MKTDPAASELEVLARRAEQLGRTVATLEQRITLLEEENVHFARLLRERGVEVRASSQIAVELPPPLDRPLTIGDPALPPMREGERRLLEEACAGKPFFLLLRSATRVDTGHWFRRSPVWVAALADRLVLVAWGKTAWVDAVPYRHLKQSLYNHVTGEVVLAPAPGLRLDRFRVAPLDGVQVLAQIYAHKEDAHA
jgi:hypothetical protein